MWPDDYNDPKENERSMELRYCPAEEPPKPKKARVAAKIAALCLVCALLGGIFGAGGTMLIGGRFGLGGSTTIYQGSHTPAVVDIANVTGEELLNASQIYSAYVGSTVGITVDIVTTNGWGIPVTTAAAGSGFVITSDGYILTNYHVIEDANTIKVSFVDGVTYDAALVGSEADNDIAVLKIAVSGLKPAVIGNSDNVTVGETVVAIGNPLGELTFSLSQGVISALDRKITMSDGSIMNMLQTDTAINSGNSGGPLFNSYGQVIGITTAKYSTSMSSQATIEGLGFAIPINDVRDMVTDIIEHGYVTGQPFLGISVGNVSAEARQYGIPAGARIALVTPGYAADKAGLRAGDIVTAIDETQISSSDGLITAVATYAYGDTAALTVYRDGETLTISVTFDEKTAESVRAHSEYAAQQNEQTQQQTDPGGQYYVWPFGGFGR